MDTMNDIRIPRPEEVKTTSGLTNWRIADGKIVKGREADGTLEPAPYGVLGQLVRVGVHHGVLDDGRTYAKVECELKTADGVQSVGASLTSRMAAISLGEGLLAAKKGDLIKVEAHASAKLNRYNKKTTYASVYRINPETLATVKISEPVLPDYDDLDEAIEAMERMLKEHDAYGERPNRREEEERNANRSAFEQFKDDLKANNLWPDFDLARPGYLSLVEKLAGSKVKDPADPALESCWAQMRDQYAKSREKGTVPKALQAYLAPPEDHDPFDE